MLGTIANVTAIIIGSLFGFLLRGGISDRFNDTIMKGLALCVIIIGISGAIKSDNILLLILSVAIGAVIGEAIDLDGRLQKFGDEIEAKFKGRGGKVSQGFVTSSLLFCVGAMSIVGSLESGLTGNYKILFAKSILDGVVSIVLASSLGIGVLLSAFSVLIYQGTITFASSLLKDVLVEAVRINMTAAGSLLIVGIGLNMLGTAKIKVANLLPAVLIPILYQLAMNIFTK
jgi:uncharacterized protein